jgi:hypothetical protein
MECEFPAISPFSLIATASLNGNGQAEGISIEVVVHAKIVHHPVSPEKGALQP